MEIVIPLVEGFEEIEAVAVIDVLRRAGIKVTTVGAPSTIVLGAHGLQIVTDKKMDSIDFKEFDGIVLPGGPGHQNLLKSQRLLDALADFNYKGKLVAAICASPLVLAKAGVLKDKKATIYPGMEREIPRPRPDKVVVDGNIITGQAPGSAIEFAIRIVEKLIGRDKANKLRKDLVHEAPPSLYNW